MIWGLLLGLSVCSAGRLNFLPKWKSDEAKVSKNPEKLKSKTSEGTEAKLGRDALFQALKISNEKINELLNQKNEEGPLIWQESQNIQAGKIIRARLLNSVVAGAGVVPVILWVKPDQGFPYKTKLLCQGALTQKRLLTICNKAVGVQSEVAINALALNTDGTQGIRGSYKDGKDLALVGAILSSFGQGLLTAAQSKVGPGVSEGQRLSTKNISLSGAVESAGMASDSLFQETQKTEGFLTIPAGIEVLVLFQEGVNGL